MKNLSKSIFASSLIIVSFVILSTGCGKKGGGVKTTEKMNMLMANSWKLQINETIKETTDNIKDSTGITADIKLDGDVGDFANFIAETLKFGKDNKDKTKLSYSRTIGEGILSSSVLGFWSLSADESTVIMREWDTQKGELPPVNYKIVELTADKLVLLKDGDSAPTIYKAK